MKPIYGLICGIPNQQKIIENHCFGDCGKIIAGAIMDKTIGELGVCRTPKDQCPYIDKEMDEPFGEVMGDPVYIRKLRSVVMRCPDYDDPTKIIDETAEEYLCEYCCMRGKECDGKGNITQN